MTSIHKYPPRPETHKRIEQFFSKHSYPVAERMIADQEKEERLDKQQTAHTKEERVTST